MSYSIGVRVIQHSDPAHCFSVVEKTNWHAGNGCTWAESDGVHTLTMGGSGTSGMMRFKNHAGDYFLVALGVHNYKRWCDIVTDAKCCDTGVVVHPTYYEEGPCSRGGMLWKQLPYLEKTTSNGAKVTVEFTQGEGYCLQATITIATGCHLAPSCHPQPTTSHPHPTTSHPQPTICHPQPTTCHPQPTICHPQPTTCHPQPTTCHPQPTTYHLHSTTYHPQPITYHPQPTTWHPQPTIYHPQPTTCHPQPTTYHPHATTCHPQPTTWHTKPECK